MKNWIKEWKETCLQARSQQQQQCEAAQAHRELIEDLLECRRQMEQADVRFNLLSEPELIESCVYEYRALQVRYDCLVRKARETGCPTATMQV